MDVLTLFVANAVVALVMGVSFLAAWLRRKDQHYLLSWAQSCAVFTVAFLCFVASPHVIWGIELPHALLVLGFGLRWRAARQFTGHVRNAVDGSFWVVAPTLVIIAPLLLPSLADDRTVYLAGNAILTCQAAAIAWHFYARCSEKGLARWGLILAYCGVMMSFMTSVILGARVGVDFDAFLQRHELVSVHLMIALMHGVAGGTFALAMAYNRAETLARHEHELAEERARSFSRLAERDALTGLMNRRVVETRFTGLQRSGFDTVAVLDLDHFKDINDRFGHATGDAVLRATAEALAPDEDCLAVRLGGEEFMLFLRGDAARERAEQRRQAIALRVATAVEGLDRMVTASMGVVEMPLCEQAVIPFSDFYIAADRLLYQAKQQGRNCTVFGSLRAGPGGELVSVLPPRCLDGEMEEPCVPMREGRVRSPSAAEG